MSSDVIRIAPERLRYKLADVSDLEAPVWPGDWDLTRRLPLDQTAKHRAIVQRYRDGVPWEATALFREVYPVRFARGEVVHGCATIEALAAQYYSRTDGLFADLRAHGYRELLAHAKVPEAYLARDGEVILGNDGNHRVAMAKLLGLPSVLVRIRTRHPGARIDGFERAPSGLHDGADRIPAMTTIEERVRGYELARAQAPHGAIVELGAWLGAMTVYLAAGVRDADAPLARVHTYDRFAWKPVHTIKAGGPLTQSMRAQFEANLGPLRAHVAIHPGDFRAAMWDGTPIGLLVLDGPKRVAELVRTLPIFGGALLPGARMAWQDFAHFASYDLPASLDTLERAGVVAWEEAVYPGTMSVFRVLRPITAADVSADRLRLDRWTPDAIVSTWDRWALRLPPGQRPRFHCGAALFLCDRGFVAQGVAYFRAILGAHRADIARKWQMIRETRPEFLLRYPALDAEMAA